MNSKVKIFSFGVIVILFSMYMAGCISSPETTTGKLAFQQKDFVKAEQELSKGVVADKDDFEAWYMLGVSRIEIGKYDGARECFVKSKTAFGDLQLIYWVDKYNEGIKNYNDGVTMKKKADEESAKKYFEKSLYNFKAGTIIIPDSISAYQMMGDCYVKLGQNDSALAVYSSILDKSKSKEDAIMIASIMLQTGVKAREGGNYEAALDIFNKIIKINYLPKDDMAYSKAILNIGLTHYNIAEKMLKEGAGDYKPHLQAVVDNLVPLSATLKDNDMLNAVYELLINSYDGLGDQAKSEEYKAKQSELKK
jgi:tetratricopeptide (TPR) repeat protein